MAVVLHVEEIKSVRSNSLLKMALIMLLARESSGIFISNPN